MKYAVFTVGMPEYDLENAVKTLKECGYDGVEWRVTTVPTDPAVLAEPVSYWGNNKCTVNIDTVVEEAENIKALCQKYGVEICALGTYMKCSDHEGVEKALKAASIMGCPKIRVNASSYNGEKDYWELLEQDVKDFTVVEQLAKKYNVKVNIEMHMGLIVSSASAAYRLVSNFDSNYIGVIYDTGNVVYEGYENTKMAFEILGKYLDHVHIKNAKWELKSEENGVQKWAPTWATFQTGHTDFAKVIKTLKEIGYDGYLTFEDFSNQESTEEKLKNNLAYIRSVVESAESAELAE